LGVGYAISCNIIQSLFDKIDISLKYEDLFDAKTRLKELFEYKQFNIGTFKYTVEVIDRIQYARVVQKVGGRKIVIGKGSATKKAAAEQKAAKQALAYLKRRGFEKPVSEGYKMFCLPSQF
jgi:dsRNA-specific ribonuclease